MNEVGLGSQRRGKKTYQASSGVSCNLCGTSVVGVVVRSDGVCGKVENASLLAELQLPSSRGQGQRHRDSSVALTQRLLKASSKKALSNQLLIRTDYYSLFAKILIG